MSTGERSKPLNLSDVRVLFFGMTGILSRVTLTLLLNSGANVCGMVIPASVLPPYVLPRTPHLPISSSPHLLVSSPGILELAAQHQLPVYPVRRLKDEETLAIMTAVSPDLICVSCFNQILPPALLQIPRLGCLNLHPSLLPQFRGPSPLFWVFRQGQNQCGVTIHFMDEGLDTGDIALQASLTFPDGISGAQAEQMCAERGGRLMVEVIKQLVIGNWKRQPQAEGGTYYPAPTPDDFRLDTSWSARRAFNFMRGTAEWARPYPIHIAGKEVVLRTAVSHHPNQTIPQPILWHGRTVSIQFSPGVLIANV
jgi:methionyl-tRNA formyltransferase